MLKSNEGKKRQRYPVKRQVRKALATMLYRKGFPEEYVAALIGWKFDESILSYDIPLKRMVNPILDDEEYRKKQVLKWLKLLKEEIPNPSLATLIDQEIKRLHQ